MCPRLSPPRIAVLLATHNGMQWLPDQLHSILTQDAVTVRVIALDDASTDGTREWLLERASADPRLTVLPRQEPSGGAAANFFRILLQADLDEDELVAFSDQDDIWMQGKLERHARFIREEDFDAVSSSVTSFRPDGHRALVAKHYPQRTFDYLFESPGPGCTFLMTPALVALVRQVLIDSPEAKTADFHDSLIYAIARARGLRWRIDELPTVDYRQHGGNVLGSNLGLRPAFARLRLISQQWHRGQARLMGEVALTIAAPAQRAELETILPLVRRRDLKARVELARLHGRLRRRPRDQRILGLLIALGVW